MAEFRTTFAIIPATTHGAPMHHSLLVSVRALSKTFDVGLRGCTARVRALDDIHLDVSRGEVVGIVGETGAGKTTLLRCLARLLVQDKGVIELAPTDRHSVAAVMYLQDPVELARLLDSDESWDIAVVDNADAVFGDVGGAFALLAAARRIRAIGGAMVLAARDQRAIAPVAHRVIMLERGHVGRGQIGTFTSVPRVAEETRRRLVDRHSRPG